MAEAVYSVWAIPPEGVTQRLKKLMSALRSEFGGPEFDPHITVVGATKLTHHDALRNLRAVVYGGAATATLKPYPARLSAVSCGTSFFQCVYFLVDPSPRYASSEYMPHLSLLYGDLSEEERRRAAAMAEALASDDLIGLSFPVAALALYKTDTGDKTLDSWEKVAVFELAGDDSAQSQVSP
ncbi:unnamed protein product [Spirodela intermedia]|uniref:Uncharacterized protein n=1 Tax=Spirodela intermedia TaxID=51605 RepID=A0A7I8JS50_SPIIN|nr:unnamed protein product [Spirodela intermedia]CAA6673006.1 unnamed protein product [Spirodela intermedia]